MDRLRETYAARARTAELGKPILPRQIIAGKCIRFMPKEAGIDFHFLQNQTGWRK